MGYPGAGSSAGGQPAGVAVLETTAPAAAAAAPAAAGASPVSRRVACVGSSTTTTRSTTTTTTTTTTRSAGGALACTRLTARLALPAALFLLGCAAAGLALFAMILPPADSRLLGKACAPPTDAEVASLRTASECLLLAASLQVVAATMALLVPARILGFSGNLLGLLTAYHAIDVLVKLLCHDSADGELASFWVLYIMLWPAFVVCAVVSLR